MSCTFWVQRKKRAAKLREQKLREAEIAEQMAETPKVTKKSAKKAVESNDNA